MNQATVNQLDRMANHPAVLSLVGQPRQLPPRANLSFTQAVDRLLTGERLCRLDWPASHQFVTLPPAANGQLQLTDQADVLRPYNLAPDDLTIDDWYVVEGDKQTCQG